MPIIQTTTDASLHYDNLNATAGGTPVIAIHGLLGTARSQLGHVLDWLVSEGYHTIGLTLRGYGESGPKPRDFPYDFYHRDADDLLAFMDALDITQAHLLGYSDGGEVVLAAAGKAPERIATVAAWGAVGNFGPELRPAFQRTHPGSAWITPEDLALHAIPDADAFTRAWVRSTTRMIDAGGDVSLSTAHRITAPCLIMLGRDDTLNPVDYAQKYLERTPDGYLDLFDCGHPVHDQQTEAFYAAVRRHLARADKSSA